MALIFSQGNPNQDMFEEYFNYTRNMFEFLGYNVVDVLNSQDNTVPGVVKDKKAVMENARELGLKLTKSY